MRRVQSVVFILFLCTSAVFGSAALALCEEKRVFDQLRAQTNAFFTTGTPLNAAQNNGLARGLSQLNLLTIFPILAANNQTMHAPFLNKVLSEFAVLQRSGRRDVQVLNVRNIEKTAQIFEELCANSQVINQATIGVNERLILERFDFNFTNPFRGWTGADVRSFFNLSLVFFVLLGLISLIVFFWKAYVLAFPFLENRRHCKIPANLIVEGTEVVGHVTTLGPFGARFIPMQNDEYAGSINAQSEMCIAQFASGSQVFAVSLQSVMSELSVIAFHDKLDRNTLNDLYETSEVPTRFASNSVVPSRSSSQSSKRRIKPSGHKIRKAPAL